MDVATTSYADRLAENLAAVRARIAAACTRAGRQPDAARLVAVTKGLGAAATVALWRLGQEDLAENRVQVLEAKMAAVGAAVDADVAAVGAQSTAAVENRGRAARGIAAAGTGRAPAPPSPPPAPPRWHLIGHLQRNKAKRFLASGALLHALDGEGLLDELARRLADRRDDGHAGATSLLDAFVEVNLTGEPQKHGVAPAALDPLLDRAAAGGRVRVTGLLCMTREGASEADARATFRALRALRDRAQGRHPQLRELSMGMTQDFEVACEEGATLVRVGSALASGLPAEALAAYAGVGGPGAG